MGTLTGKVAIVTGASSGIGEATALALGQRGASVTLAARRQDRLDALAKRVNAAGGKALAIKCDVVKRADVKRVIDETMRVFGRIDILVNNAGIMPNAPIIKCRMDDWDATIDVNIKGLLYGIGFALPVMLAQKSGHIINVSSVGGRKVFPNAAVYCGSKHAVHAISEGLRGELAEYGKDTGSRIRVTVIAPGVVATELPDSITDDEVRSASKEYYGSIQPPLTGDDVAAAIVYAVEAPPHVNVNEILIRPTAQLR